MTWMTGSYDPELNLVYWGTGNPNPVLAGEGRLGDTSIPARLCAERDTGNLVWYFQPSPHDVHDWDAVQTPMLFDGDFRGQQRKMVAQLAAMVLLRAGSQDRRAPLTTPFVETNWAKGINGRGATDSRYGKDLHRMEAWYRRDRTVPQLAFAQLSIRKRYGYVSARRQWSVFYRQRKGRLKGGWPRS